MSDSENLATALLPHVTFPDAAGHLMKRAEINVPLRAGAALAGDIAAAEARGPVARVITAAQSTSDPVALAKLAKDRRITVLRAIAANPATSLETCSALHDYAISIDDADLYGPLVSRLPLAELLDGRNRTALWTSHVAERVANAAVGGPDLARLRVILADGELTLTSRALYGIYRGVEGITFEEACDLVPTHAFPAVLGWILDNGHAKLDERLMAQYLKPDVRTVAAAQQRSIRKAQMTAQAALDLLAAGPLSDAEIWWLVNLSHETDAVTAIGERLVEGAPPESVTKFLSLYGSDLDSDLAHRIIRRAVRTSEGAATIAAEAFATVAHQLESDLMLTLLRNSLPALACQWAGGKFASKPQPGDVAALFADPGSTSSLDISVLAWATTLGADSLLNTVPWGDELMDALGSDVPRYARTRPTIASYVASRLGRCFGDVPELWQMAVTLAPDWEGNLAELIEISYISCGISPPTAPEAPVELDMAEGQLSFL